MDFNSIHQRLTAINAPGMLSVDTPREADPEVKTDKGRAGESFVLIDPSSALDFLIAVRDDKELAFDILVDLTEKCEGSVLMQNTFQHIRLLGGFWLFVLVVFCVFEPVHRLLHWFIRCQLLALNAGNSFPAAVARALSNKPYSTTL